MKELILILFFTLVGCKTFRHTVFCVKERYSGLEFRATGNVVLSEDGKSILEEAVRIEHEIAIYSDGKFIWKQGRDTNYTEYFGEYERKGDTLALRTRVDWIADNKGSAMNAYVYKSEKPDKVILQPTKQDTMLMLTRSGLIYFTKLYIENLNVKQVKLSKKYVGEPKRERKKGEPNQRRSEEFDDYTLSLKKNGTYSLRILQGDNDIKQKGSWGVYAKELILIANSCFVTNGKERKQGASSLITKIQLRNVDSLFIEEESLWLRKR